MSASCGILWCVALKRTLFSHFFFSRITTLLLYYVTYTCSNNNNKKGFYPRLMSLSSLQTVTFSYRVGHFKHYFSRKHLLRLILLNLNHPVPLFLVVVYKWVGNGCVDV